jgi:hypothetical protein
MSRVEGSAPATYPAHRRMFPNAQRLGIMRARLVASGIDSRPRRCGHWRNAMIGRTTASALAAPLVLALTLVAAACGGGSSDPKGSANTVSVGIGEPKHLVPSNATETEGHEVLSAVFTALVEYDAEYRPSKSRLPRSPQPTTTRHGPSHCAPAGHFTTVSRSPPTPTSMPGTPARMVPTPTMATTSSTRSPATPISTPETAAAPRRQRS